MSLKVNYEENGDITYTTIDGDMVDFIAFKHYGHHRKTAEAILDANPGLADRGVVLDAGVKVVLPELKVEPDTKEFITLWD